MANKIGLRHLFRRGSKRIKKWVRAKEKAEEIRQELKHALEEVELYRQGKIKLKSARIFLLEMERELDRESTKRKRRRNSKRKKIAARKDEMELAALGDMMKDADLSKTVNVADFKQKLKECNNLP